MSLIKCPECGKEISDKANSCPSCGFSLNSQSSQQSTAKSSKKKKGCLIGCIAFFVLILIGFCSNDNSTNKATQTSSSKPVETVKPVLTITAMELFDAFMDNELKANQAYKGKYIAVQGAVESIGEDIVGDPYVALNTGNPILKVQCMLNKSETGKAANLQKGQQIIIQGNCAGKFGNVLIRSCSIK